MPNNENSSKIAQYIETLEEQTLCTKKSRVKCFECIKSIFDEGGPNVSLTDVKRILAVFMDCMKDDIQYLPHAIATISSLLTKVKIIQSIPVHAALLPSALALLHTLKTLCASDGAEALREMSFELFLSYPVEVLTAMVTHNCDEILEIFEVYRGESPNVQIGKEMCVFLKKLLTILPSQPKKQFVEEGLQIWFADFLPSVMHLVGVIGFEHKMLYIDCLEILTEALLPVEYFECHQWKFGIFRNICDFEKYPRAIMTQLQSDSDIWHRLWIVFIKLLKNQITRSCGSNGTPINLLLPVVEHAFKRDEINKCRALACWRHLIDNFSNETNQNCLPKRIKLLLTPLKLSNAKTPAMAQAKFETWWHLITKFQGKLDKCLDEIVIPFLYFAFGKNSSAKKTFSIGVGQSYNGMSLQCLQAFAQIVGHGDCNCCTNLPKLNGKLLNNKLLASNWNDWMFALKEAIKLSCTMYKESANNHTNTTPKPLLCIWRAFVITIAELPPNAVRRDMFDGLIQILIDYTESFQEFIEFQDIVFSLALSLFEDNEKIQVLLITGKGDEQPLKKILMLMLNPGMQSVHERFETKIMVEMLKPLTNLTVESKTVDWLIDNLTPCDGSLKLWTALVQSVRESTIDFSPKILSKLLTWPVKSLHLLTVDQYAAMAWCTMYNLVSSLKSVCDTELEKDIFIQCVTKTVKQETIYFEICLTTSLLKNKLVQQKDPGVLPEVLQNLTSQMSDYKEYEQVLPILIDTIVEMLNYVAAYENEQLAKISLNCVQHVLKVIIPEMKSHVNEGVNQTDADTFVILNNLFNTMKLLVKVPVYSDINCNFINELTEQALTLSKESTLFKFIVNQLKTLTEKLNGAVRNKIKDSLEKLNRDDAVIIVEEFTSPDVKKIIKRAKKKEASIVNTVVENGEEYVVVKSNWKFNPRKLTENQKEKFQKKREDIPALYQDLSQSQDEFKLTSWKTDSQDTTSTNSKSSKSTTNDDASSILKNMPSADVVPNIMTNIMAENDKNHATKKHAVSVEVTECNLKKDTSNKMDRLSLTPKNTRSPRMALKDRVFRNVRNLIEKSSPNTNTTEKNCTECHIENVPITPSTKSNNNANLSNSAPSLLPADRPHRTKRKPKKFDDVQLFGLKKRRSSQNESLSNSPIESDMIVICESNNDNANIAKLPNAVNVNIDKPHTDQVITRQSTTEIVEKVHYVQDVPELEVTEVTPHDAAQNNLDEHITKKPALLSNKDDVSDIQKNDVLNNLINDDDRHRDKNDTTQDNRKKVDEEDGQKEVVQNNLINNDDRHSDRKDITQDNQIKIDDEDVQKNVSKDVQKNGSKDVKKNGSKDVQKNDNNVTVEINNEIENENIAATLQTPATKTKEVSQKSATKKSTTKKSRIEKELAIDMVEGHPYLQIQSEKRITRKKNINDESRRSSLNDKLNKRKQGLKTPLKANKKPNQNVILSFNNLQSTSLTVEETQERSSSPENTSTSTNEDAPYSEDVIESSQDSTLTTISVKTAKRTPAHLPFVTIERIKIDTNSKNIGTQDLLQDTEDCEMIKPAINKHATQESKDDIELPQNKTAEVENNQTALTENMDTEPIIPDDMSDDVIVIDDDIQSPITLNTEGSVGLETQELAEADTQPNDPAVLDEFKSPTIISPSKIELFKPAIDTEAAKDTGENIPVIDITAVSALETQEDIVMTSEPDASINACIENDTDVSSPFKDDVQRKKDFLNNTSEISPIKVQSPDLEKTSPTKETSSDYMVVKLTSPVQSNGEPFDKNSPEVFTTEKISPDKRDLSPPRVEFSVNSGSPSSSLSLKKNRPQCLRPSGRAAQMLGLCVPDSLNTIKNFERVEPEEPQKGNTSTPVRRNLRILYNSENGDTSGETEEHDQFLKFKKDLPSTDSSPSVPILKRKHIDIVDESTASPANKKKRVSFHDPPVSTTVSVQKYIEPGCIKSPSSASKRLERQTMRTYAKSPKRLDNTFVKLDTVLSKAVESFTDEQADSLTTASLDVTPAAEVVNTSELNDTDPICPELVDCKDSIENIALELSSPVMKELFIKELEGKVITVGDLAKMTELEINRFCIKAPKVQIAKKVLTDYMDKRLVNTENVIDQTVALEDDSILMTEMNEEMTMAELKHVSIETQTDDVAVSDMEVQTRIEIVKLASTQTNNVPLVNTSIQTVESGSRTTGEIISCCLSERDDFLDRLNEQLEETSRRKISENLHTDTLIDILANKCDDSTLKLILNKIFDKFSRNDSSSEGRCNILSSVNDYLCDNFDTKDLMLFGSKLFKSVYDKQT